MRIRYLFLLPGLFVVHLTTAQSIALGLRGGVGQACHHRYFDEDYKPSYHLRPILSKAIGLNTTLGLGSHLSLEVGLNYEEKGNIRYAVKNQYRYVSLPVTLKYNLFAERTISPYLRGGAYYAHLLHHQQTVIEDGPIDYIYLPEYQTPATKDMGVVAAIGADWQLSTHLQLNVDLSGSRGVCNLYAADASSLILTYPFYNISWNLATGVQYVF